MRFSMLTIPAALLAASLGGCPPSQQTCGSDDPRIGQRAALTTREHGVSGTARITDNCTILLENFNYDGQGLVVRVYGSTDPQFQSGVYLSDNIRRLTPYVDAALELKVPEGASLADVPFISVYCVDVGVSFGDGEFK